MEGHIKYPKSSGDDLLLQTSFSDHGDHIFWKGKRRERRHLVLCRISASPGTPPVRWSTEWNFILNSKMVFHHPIYTV